MANACSTHGKARILAKHSEFETYDGFFNKLTLLSSVYKLFNWQIWVVTQPYPVQISERDIHTIFTSINITQYWWWVSRWGPLIEALHTAYWTLFISCFYPSPVSVVEKPRINPLPDIPERTFSIEDPPEEKKGYFMIYKEWDKQFYLNNWMIGMVANSLPTLLRSAGWADLG